MLKWKIFKTGSGIADGLVSIQLFQYEEESLSNAMIKVASNITAKSTNDVLELMKLLAVIPVAIGVLRVKLLDIKQKRDKPSRTFSSRFVVRRKRVIFTNSDCKTCNVINRINYTDHMMQDVRIAWIYDADIRREVLEVKEIVDRSVNEIISILEKKEMVLLLFFLRSQ